MTKQQAPDLGGLILIRPAMRHYSALMAVDRDYIAAGEEPYCGVKSRASFALWLWAVREQAGESVLANGSNQNEIHLLMRGETILACGQLRPVNTRDVLTWAGHIGYSVPPSLRGKGYAKRILKMLLDEAFSRGLERVLLTCDETNLPSRLVIEHTGGVYEDQFTQDGYDKRRYWFYKKNWPAAN